MQKACLFYITQRAKLKKLKTSSAISTLNTWKGYLRMMGVPYEDKGHGPFLTNMKYLFQVDAQMEEEELKKKVETKHLTVRAMMWFEANWDKVPDHLRLAVACYMWICPIVTICIHLGIDQTGNYAPIPYPLWDGQASKPGGSEKVG